MLKQLIQLKSSLEDLSDAEFNQFKQKWIMLLDKDIITQSIFCYFHQTKQTETNQSYKLPTITAHVINIINSRKKNTSNTAPSTTQELEDVDMNQEIAKTEKIDQLPCQLIGAIGSYLRTKEYIKFEQSNRQIYSSCNAPSSLQILQIEKHDDHDISMPFNINFTLYPTTNAALRQKYSLICMLSVPGCYFLNYMEVNQTNTVPWRHLTKLELNGMYCGFNAFISANNLIPLQNITTLSCKNFGVGWANGETTIDRKTLFKFLQLFVNLEILMFDSICFTQGEEWKDDGMDQDIKTSWHKLKAVSSVGCHDAFTVHKIIAFYGHQLESLEIGENFDEKIFSERGFAKLKDLKLQRGYFDDMTDAVKTMSHLQLIQVRNSYDPDNISDVGDCDLDKLKVFLLRLIETSTFLQFVEFDCLYDDMETAVVMIKDIMNESHIFALQRKEFSIKLNIMECDEIEIETVKECVECVVDVMGAAKMKNFILEFMFCKSRLPLNMQPLQVDDKNGKTNMMDEWRKYLLCFHEYDIRWQRFVISNKDCKIQGFQPRYIAPNIFKL